MSLGTRIFDLRQTAKVSLQHVADAVGISKAHVWELEKGRSANPSFELVQKLANSFVSCSRLGVDGEAEERAAGGLAAGALEFDVEAQFVGGVGVANGFVERSEERRVGKEC